MVRLLDDQNRTDIAAHVCKRHSGSMGRPVVAHRAEVRDVLRWRGANSPETLASAVRSDGGEDGAVEMSVDFAL